MVDKKEILANDFLLEEIRLLLIMLNGRIAMTISGITKEQMKELVYTDTKVAKDIISHREENEPYIANLED